MKQTVDRRVGGSAGGRREVAEFGRARTPLSSRQAHATVSAWVSLRVLSRLSLTVHEGRSEYGDVYLILVRTQE